MFGQVYITRLAKFLPNKPVSNDDIEKYLGYIDDNPSKAKNFILRSNKIKTRYYAIDQYGKPTHTNAQLTSNAVKGLLDEKFNVDEIELLSVGTASADQILPSHSSMIHAELGGKPIETVSFSAGCCAGTHALKYGFLSVLTGEKNNAVCTGSELISAWMLARNFEPEIEALNLLEENPILAFEKEFLRYMLSDGAGAALLESEPRDDMALRIDWLENYSYANLLGTCMYAGGDKNPDGTVKGWRLFQPGELTEKSVMLLKQDVKLLNDNIIRYGMISLVETLKKRNLDLSEIDWFLPHLSSEFFRQRIVEELKVHGYEIPQDKWFTNLTKFGNVGAASVYLMLEELFNTPGVIKKGDKILIMVPESARFSYTYGLLTVV